MSLMDVPFIEDLRTFPKKVEADPSGKDQHEKGSKLDAGKAPIYQGVMKYFPRAIMAIANVSGLGARKYTWDGWESVPEGEDRYGNARERHIVKERIEGLWDSDAANDPKHPADLLHAAQVAWNALAHLELKLRRLEREGIVDALGNKVNTQEVK